MSLKEAAEYLRAQGRGKDTELVHLTKDEVRAMGGLALAAGGALTRNPKTGLLEAGFLDSMLPTILGVAANFVVPGSGVVVGGLTGALQNEENPLMGAALGAAGGYGGGELANGLQTMGAAAPEAAASAIQHPLLTSGVSTAPGSQAAMLASQNAAAGGGAEGLAQLAQAGGGAAPSSAGLAGIGAEQAVASPTAYINQMGGPMETAKLAGMAAAPALGATPEAEDDKPDWANAKGEKYRYDAGYTGGTATGPAASSERRWFNPTFTRMAHGGAVRYAEGGVVEMESGGFVIPADVVSMAGGGSTDAGLAALAQHVGARPIRGAGDGMSDDIPARIDGKPVARVANGEAYVPRETVQKLGGARKLYRVMDSIRHQAHGKKQQQRPVDLKKAMG